jgi:murein DD-endopeptidase MepM/ murein hydrolase activator NlpD
LVGFRHHYMLLLLACLIASDSAKAGYCLEDWACWEVRETSEGYEFWVKNQKPYSFTGTLDIKVKNLRSVVSEKARYVETEVISGNSEQRLLTLYPVDENERASYRDIFYWTPGDMEARHDDEFLYQLPFAIGKRYPLVQGFGGGWSHRGASRYAVDFAMPVGTAVHAARPGIVVQTVAHNDKGGASRRYAAYANFIVVLHADGTTGEYHHLKKGGVKVNVGEEVKVGELIGYSGNTGFSSLPHLHFAVYRPKPMGDFESLPFRFVNNASTKRHW